MVHTMLHTMLHTVAQSLYQAHLAGLALGVDLAQAGPLAQRLLLGHGDEVDALLRAQRLNQLLVVGLVAVVRQDGQLAVAVWGRGQEGRERRRKAA